MIYTIVGVRPNFIKIDPELPQVIIHTGQHYDDEMSESFFQELKIPAPKVNLECKGDEIGKMIDKLRKIFKKKKPSLVLVFGDAHSSLAGALAARYEDVKVAHVEAGLRSGRDMPEETNRIAIDHIASVRLCPNANAELNLIKEGLAKDNYMVGDPMFDTMARFLPIKRSKDYQKYILLTIHRDFNLREKLQDLFDALEASKEKIVFPCHPHTESIIKDRKIRVPKNIRIVPPASYRDSLALISNAKKVITDSGGVQREAFWMNVPVIIFREETEWPDIVVKGGAVLAYHKETLLDAIRHFKGKLNSPPSMGANKKIKEILFRYA